MTVAYSGSSLLKMDNQEGDLSRRQRTYELKELSLGDFVIDDRYLFEVGGEKKWFTQIKDICESYVVSDNIETGTGNRIPLWLFGFLY